MAALAAERRRARGMNMDLTITAVIAKVSLTTKQKDDVIRRVCKVTLAREFDNMIAAAMGPDAKEALAALETGGISKVEIPLDAITASAKFVCGSSSNVAAIPVLRGVKATGKASKDEEFPPSIRLEFEFDFLTEAWIFFGRNHTAWGEITLAAVQPELPFGPPSARPRAGA
jgi:hypothetical protein